MMRCTTITATVLLLACGDNLTRPPNLGVYEPAAPIELSCVPNLDGQLASTEAAEALGVPARFLVNPAGTTRGVDVAGQINASGDRLWDWSSVPASDAQLGEVVASALTDKWYASSFPGATFVGSGDLGGRLENIYSRDASGLYLHGIASAQESPAQGQTLLIYEQPVELYRFPLTAGKAWVSVGRARNSTLLGLPYAGKDTYEIGVEAVGELRLPDLIFDQAYQLFTKVTVEPSVGAPVVTRQVSFFAECFGEVARATSATGESEKFFSTASELRRLGIGF